MSAHTPHARNACASCSLREHCLPAGLNQQEANALDMCIKHRRALVRGDHLFHDNAPMQALYAIHSGFMKTSLPHVDGREQVIGFHMPGDLLGMDAIGGGRHMCNAAALEDCEVCEISLDALETLSREMPLLMRHFHRIMSREIVHDHGMMLLLGGMRADERLAVFLLGLSQRHAARGYCATEFLLRMTRGDIGSYLGLKLETVSRALSRMQARKLIEVRNRNVRIINIEGLRQAGEKFTRHSGP